MSFARMTTLAVVALGGPIVIAAAPNTDRNLIDNGTLERVTGGKPDGFTATGAADYGPLGDARRDIVSRGFLLRSDRPSGEAGCTVSGLAAKAGRWFRFTVRALPQTNFAVRNDDLSLKVAFFGHGGTTSYDAKAKPFYDQIETARKDLSANGVRHRRGAEVWRTYQLDFCLPFPQVDTVKPSIAFGHGAATSPTNSALLVDDFSLVALPEPADLSEPPAQPMTIVPSGDILPIGGRWFYAAKPGETTAPGSFTAANLDRLLYHDNVYTAPFAAGPFAPGGAWLRAGNPAAARAAARRPNDASGPLSRYPAGQHIQESVAAPPRTPFKRQARAELEGPLPQWGVRGGAATLSRIAPTSVVVDSFSD